MAEQHKSGPWVYEDYSMDGKLFVVPGDYIGTICSIEARGSQSVANARLIAAAPELLGALEVAEANLTNIQPHIANGVVREEFIAILDGYIDPILSATRAAIAKAKGEA